MKYFIAVLLVASSSIATAADLTNKEFVEVCSKKTKVMNKQGAFVGEKLGGFCVGYLQGSLGAVLSAGQCSSPPDSTPDYLLSIYESYVKDKKIKETESAPATVVQAFRRAADCK